MAKQPGDKKTIELPGLPKRLGRSLSGCAKSVSQRQKEFKARNNTKLMMDGNLGGVATSFLIQKLLNCFAEGEHFLSGKILSELSKRRDDLVKKMSSE